MNNTVNDLMMFQMKQDRVQKMIVNRKSLTAQIVTPCLAILSGLGPAQNCEAQIALNPEKAPLYASVLYPDLEFYQQLTGLPRGNSAGFPNAFVNPGFEKKEYNRRPNIIVLFIDDLGYGDIGAFGCPDIPTPNIDLLAKEGVSCTNAYTICPVCSPSRVGIMTGMYPNRFGVFGNEDRGAPIPEDHPTLAEFMRDAGYVTGMVGRWDIGEPDQGPLAEGFMEVARRSGLPGSDPRRALTDGPSYMESDGVYLTDRQGDEMVEFVTRHKDKPFFLYFAPLGIHYPVQEVPQKYLDRVPKQVTDEHRRHLGATLIAIDDAIGKVMGAINTLGLDEETLVFFTGDNGGQESGRGSSPSAYGGSRNLPYRGGKATPWDGAVHEPFIVRWTNHVPAGKTFDGMLSTMDVYATAAAVAGKKAPARCEGFDLLPYMAGNKKGDVHKVLFWRWLEGANPRSVHAVRKGKWRIMRVLENDPWQLYDLVADPGEKTNLAGKYPQIVEDLALEYTKWAGTLPGPSGKHREPGGRVPAGTGWATPENP